MKRTTGTLGWSLVELLTVVAIMGILGAFAASGLSGMKTPAAVEASRQIAISLFREASLTASIQNRAARVLVHGDPSDRQQYMRVMRLESQGIDGSWSPLGPIVRLARGVQVRPEGLNATNGPARVTARILPSAGPLSCLAFEVDGRGVWQQAGGEVFFGPETEGGSRAADRGVVLLRRGQPLPLEP